jgi:beta propeller repeat protein
VNFAKKNFINVNVHKNGYYQKIEVLDMKKSMFLGFLLIASLFFVFGCAPTEEVSIADGSVFTGDASFGGVTGLIIGGKSRVKTKCVDSDGKKVHVKGNVYTKRVLGGRVLSSTPVKHDVCVSQSTVKEYFCKGKKVKYKTVTCKNGCSDGACRRKFVGVKSCNYAWTDEYRCEGDKLQRAWTTSRCDKKWSKRQKCEYGCSNNKCNPEPVPVVESKVLTQDSDTQIHPTVFGNHIVWQETSSEGKNDIYLYTITTGVKRALTSNGHSSLPGFSGDLVAWVNDANMKVHICDLAQDDGSSDWCENEQKGLVHVSSISHSSHIQNKVPIHVSGSWVIWVGESQGRTHPYRDIVVYNRQDDSEKRAGLLGDVSMLDVDGNKVIVLLGSIWTFTIYDLDTEQISTIPVDRPSNRLARLNVLDFSTNWLLWSSGIATQVNGGYIQARNIETQEHKEILICDDCAFVVGKPALIFEDTIVIKRGSMFNSLSLSSGEEKEMVTANPYSDYFGPYDKHISFDGNHLVWVDDGPNRDVHLFSLN